MYVRIELGQVLALVCEGCWGLGSIPVFSRDIEIECKCASCDGHGWVLVKTGLTIEVEA